MAFPYYSNNYQNYQNQYNPYGGGFYNQPQQAPQQPQMMPQQPIQQQNMNGQALSFVSGYEGAKAYIVAPNTTIYLRDSDRPYFYEKSADNQGRMSMRTFELKEVINDNASNQATSPQPTTQAPIKGTRDLATKKDIKELKEQLDEIISTFKAFKGEKPTEQVEVEVVS